jgi:hypothetical protein
VGILLVVYSQSVGRSTLPGYTVVFELWGHFAYERSWQLAGQLKDSGLVASRRGRLMSTKRGHA